MPKNTYSKVNTNLVSGRYFSTVWCTLDSAVWPKLHHDLAPIKMYCRWLSTFGDSGMDSKFLPHITLRYLGFTDELNKNKLLNDIDSFKKVVEDVITKDVELGKFTVWKKIVDGKVVGARLNWKIINIDQLKLIHTRLLGISGYQFFEELEGDNYNPHISLGEVLLESNNLEEVEKYFDILNTETVAVKLANFAINYATKLGREEFVLSKH
jgi:2'-5' RNA ligase